MMVNWRSYLHKLVPLLVHVDLIGCSSGVSCIQLLLDPSYGVLYAVVEGGGDLRLAVTLDVGRILLSS